MNIYAVMHLLKNYGFVCFDFLIYFFSMHLFIDI